MSSVSTALPSSLKQASISRTNAQRKGGKTERDTSRCGLKHYAEVPKRSCGGAGKRPTGEAPLSPNWLKRRRRVNSDNNIGSITASGSTCIEPSRLDTGYCIAKPECNVDWSEQVSLACNS